MATIRYLAAISKNPAELASFYIDEIGMRELGRSAGDDVSLTDGYFNLTLFRQRPDLIELRKDLGLHHLGVQVDSIEETIARYRELIPNGMVLREPDSIHYGGVRIFDPENNPISLSETGFGMETEERALPRIGHVAVHMLQPQRTGDFYIALFGMRELRTTQLRRRQGKFNCFIGDGFTNLAMHPYYSNRNEAGFSEYDRIGHDGTDESFEERRIGFHHFGFLMRNASQKAEQLTAAGANVADRPAIRPYAELRVVDPQGIPFDLSENKGWEVDVDKWEQIA
jgi:catechol 2,3-dioxygenase-like lactoylglutathione lyase family enzyme